MPIITPTEVIRYSDIDVNFSVANLRQIEQIENYTFGNKFNSVLYRDLVTDLTDYSTAQSWTMALAVTTGMKVSYQGTYYIAKANSTGVLPTNTEKYSLGTKFNTPCFESLWCEVLATFLAYTILENRLTRIWLKIKADGVVKMKGDNFDPASHNEMGAMGRSLLKDIEISYYNLVEYIDNTDCLAKYRTGVMCIVNSNSVKTGEYELG